MLTDEKRRLLEKKTYTVDDLCDIIKCLRAPDGCPWDREQTHESVRNNLIEETYEAIEAIDTKDPVLLREELGDILMQVIFHSRMAEEEGSFAFSEVVQGVSEKLVRRHPHVFGSVTANTAADVLKTWDAVKSREKSERKTAADKMRAIPPALPALLRAEKVGSRAAKEKRAPYSVAALLPLIKEQGEGLLSTAPEARREAAGALLFLVEEAVRLSGFSAEELLHKYVTAYIHAFSEEKASGQAPGEETVAFRFSFDEVEK